MFNSAITGYPFIRPTFFDEPYIDSNYNSQMSSFMYGPSFFINIPKIDMTPYGTWCYIAYLVPQPLCFDALQDNIKDHILLKGSSITPL